jgi:hypothetical protein
LVLGSAGVFAFGFVWFWFRLHAAGHMTSEASPLANRRSPRKGLLDFDLGSYRNGIGVQE